MIAAALLLAGTLVLPGAGAAEGARQGGPVEREWRIRTLAHSPTADPDLRSTLASGSWSERDLALDALRRSLDAGLFDPLDLLEQQELAELLAGVRALAEDSGSPNQARALAVLARWPEPVELLGMDAIAGHALPAVRLRLAEYLGARGGPAGQALLASLLTDPDARVSAQALRGWAAASAADSDWASVPEALFADLVQLLGTQGTSDPALASLSRAVSSTPSRACQVEALRLRLHGSGDVAVLASGWTAVRDARARRLLGEAARVAGVRLPTLSP